MFRYQTADEHGMPYIAQTQLRLGANYHLVLQLEWQSFEKLQEVKQTHRVVIFRDLDDILAVAQHVWLDGHERTAEGEQEVELGVQHDSHSSHAGGA